MADDPLSDRRRTHEEEYFRKRDRELVERLRQAAAADQARRDLGAKTGLTDPEMLAELQELGFTPDTVALLPLMPILETAWAEGGVSPDERALIVDVARSRGIAAGSPADQQLTYWLDRQPSADVFARATRLIGAMLGSGARADLSADELIKYCEDIAAASGGLFGLGKVSSGEKATLKRIAGALKK
ncbi:MAG TPA: hypothetical protein VES67_17430 [Vicinamibacterales bacterium]|nr:hypothetical protein [Vicinamibacterales bacterium]